MNFCLKTVVVAVCILLSAPCGAKSINQWKRQWVAMASMCKTSDDGGMEQKNTLLGEFKDMLTFLSSAAAGGQPKNLIVGKGFSHTYRGVYGPNDLLRLQDFLSQLSIFLRGSMNGSWRDAIQNDTENNFLQGLSDIPKPVQSSGSSGASKPSSGPSFWDMVFAGSFAGILTNTVSHAINIEVDKILR